MKRNIKKQVYVSEKENEIFYKMMNQITNFAEDLESMACRKEEERELYNLLFMEAGKWNAFRSNVEEFYLRPEKGK